MGLALLWNHFGFEISKTQRNSKNRLISSTMLSQHSKSNRVRELNLTANHTFSLHRTTEVWLQLGQANPLFVEKNSLEFHKFSLRSFCGLLVFKSSSERQAPLNRTGIRLLLSAGRSVTSAIVDFRLTKDNRQHSIEQFAGQSVNKFDKVESTF